MKHQPISFAKQIADRLTPIYEHALERQQVAWWLLQAITQFDDAHLVSQAEIELTSAQEQTLAEWLDKHINQHMPLQYILGWVPFGILKIVVKPPILIPRPETEEWGFRLGAELQMLTKQNIRVLDIGTGTGCIALALGNAIPTAQITATDINDEALELAKQNAKQNKITNVNFLKSDVYDALSSASKFDLIVSNPPYVTDLEWQYLDPLVQNWEDHNALVANENGLAIIKKIINGAQKHLEKNDEMKKNNIPQLIIEIGYTQGPTVKKLLEDAGFVDVIIEQDLEGKDRVATAHIA